MACLQILTRTNTPIGLKNKKCGGFFNFLMEQKKLVEQLTKASNEISKNRKPSANYIHISEEFIQQQVDERKNSFDNMVEIIKNELIPNE